MHVCRRALSAIAVRQITNCLPTVATDALMLSILIDASEARDVATADVAGAYLKAYMDDFVVIKFVGASVDILCTLNPAHIPFVVMENGIKGCSMSV